MPAPRKPVPAAPDEIKSTQFAVLIPELEGDPIMQNMSIVEMTVTDSLLAPSTQTTIKLNDAIHTMPVKILDKFAGKKIRVGMKRPILSLLGYNDTLEVEQIIYRLSDRKPITDTIEKYNLHACDESLLVNSAQRVSKSWQCDLPSTVVNEVLSAVGSPRIDIESTGPNRPYIAENIHPFQVIAQQADVALYGGDDPCFLHYMSLRAGGTHHFRSLKSLTQAPSAFTFRYGEKGTNDIYANPETILNYQFPCDFDILSDIENGLNIDGSENVSFVTMNPFNYVRDMLGKGINSLGLGAALFGHGFTNKTTGPQAGTCEVKTENYMLRRQARLGLLDHDKLALQIVVPFNPNVFAGSVITCEFMNKAGVAYQPDYGSGTYLVTTATHTVKTNGAGFTTLECVSRGVGLSG